MNIWGKLPKPFFALAPMDDVTDTVFRQVIAQAASPDIFFTEFTNVDGLQSPGRQMVERKLRFTDSEQPLIAQIWGTKPENYYKTAQELVARGFAGIDINMGCPVAAVLKTGSCGALINNPSLAAEIIAATREGAGDLSVSVKTRLGYDRSQTEEWCGFLLEQGLDALIVHGRTVKQMSKVPADWDEIGKVARLRDKLGKATLIIGNGDVLSRQQGELLAKRHGLDGIMIGRGIFQNPWVFAGLDVDYGRAEKLQLLRQHLDLYEQTWGGHKNFQVMKKFFKMYVNGFDGAGALRQVLMEAADYQAAIRILEEA